MEENKIDNPPAFPITDWKEIGNGVVVTATSSPGISLHDYYVGKAIQGFCAGAGPVLMLDPDWFSGMVVAARTVADIALIARQTTNKE